MFPRHRQFHERPSLRPFSLPDRRIPVSRKEVRQVSRRSEDDPDAASVSYENLLRTSCDLRFRHGGPAFAQVDSALPCAGQEAASFREMRTALPGAAAGMRAALIRDVAVVPIGMTMTVRSRTVSSRNAPSSRTGNAGSRKAMSRGSEQTSFGASVQAERSPPSGTFQQDEPVS